MYKVSSKRSATSTPCHVLQPYFVNLALTLCSKAELKSQNPKRLRRKARRDQAYHSAWLSSETKAVWQQGDLYVIHASGRTQISGHCNCSWSQGLSAIFVSWFKYNSQTNEATFYSHTTKPWKLHRLHKWKRRWIFEQQDECSWHGDLGCTAPPSSLSWSGPVSVPLQHKIEEGHSMQIKLCIMYTSWKLGKCWFHCCQSLKCCCYQKSQRNLMMYSNQAQSYITDEGNTSSIFGLLASHFKSRLWF